MGLVGKMKKNEDDTVAGRPEASLSFPLSEESQVAGARYDAEGDEAHEAASVSQEAEAPPAHQDDSRDGNLGPPGEEDGGDDLMDIFTSEEEEDVNLTALTDSLLTIEAGDLLADAREITARLTELLG